MVEIRGLPQSRWRDYRRLRLESLKQSPLAFGSALSEEAGFGEREWKRRMKNTRFAMVGEEPIGMIVCSFNKEVKFRHIAEIFSFYVRPRYRGSGIGAALLQNAIRQAGDHGKIAKVRLYVNAQQRSALKMYERAGFVTVGKLEGEMKVGRRFYAMLVMEKRL